MPAGAALTFTCRLDDEVFPCASPLERTLAEGDHVFAVAAVATLDAARAHRSDPGARHLAPST
ncbi:MAG: hypothetical protein R2939_19150 [Kofleriaceae bacterium]